MSAAVTEAIKRVFDPTKWAYAQVYFAHSQQWHVQFWDEDEEESCFSAPGYKFEATERRLITRQLESDGFRFAGFTPGSCFNTKEYNDRWFYNPLLVEKPDAK
jgi:hypothetical protein